MKRLDLAINDKTGILNIPVLTEKCQQEECISVFRSLKLSQWRTGTQRGKECMGNTLYIGSLQMKFISVSMKGLRAVQENDIPIEDAEVKPF